MQGSLSQSTHTRSNLVSLGENHGYRFEGDTAILNAELAITPARDDDFGASRADGSSFAEEPLSSTNWALQLWACETPHQGGPLRGIKVAEAAVALPDLALEQGNRERLEAATFAQLPPVQREYAMVLVLASGSAGSYDQVHDFSNYPARQQFAGPHLAGSVGYRFEGDSVVLQAEAIQNPRAEGNLSGSLSLQLWALPEAYAGGAFVGSLLASTELDRLSGQAEYRAIEQYVALRQAPAGEWRLALMLREWTESAGYVTRDYCNFDDTLFVAAPVESHFDDRPYESSVIEARMIQLNDPQPEWAPADAQQAASFDESVEPSFAEPVSAKLEEPLAVSSAEPIESEPEEPSVLASEPVVSSTAEPLVTKVAEPVVVKAQEPVAAKVSESAAVQAEPAPVKSEPVDVKVAEPVVLKAVEPVVAKAVAPVVDIPKNGASKNGKPASTPARFGAPASVVKAAPAKLTAVKPVEQPVVSAPTHGVRVSVQSGSLDDLAAVPGLNKKLALSIVRARPYASLDELKAVRGIGDKMLQQLRSFLTL